MGREGYGTVAPNAEIGKIVKMDLMVTVNLNITQIITIHAQIKPSKSKFTLKCVLPLYLAKKVI